MKKVSKTPNEVRNQLLFQVLMTASFGAVVGCVISYYLLF